MRKAERTERMRELEAEMALLKEEEEREALAKEEHTRHLVLSNKELLLELMGAAEHDERGRCSGGYYHPDHGAPSCPVCALRELDEYDTEVEVEVSVTLRKKKEYRGR